MLHYPICMSILVASQSTHVVLVALCAWKASDISSLEREGAEVE